MPRWKITAALFGFTLASVAPAFAVGDTGPACAITLKAPTIAGCKSISVNDIAKSFLDLYRIEGKSKAVLDRSIKKEDVCIPFDATDCHVADYLMVEVPDHARLLFRRSDIKNEALPCTCYDARSADQTPVAGAPGAGKPNICPPERCP